MRTPRVAIVGDYCIDKYWSGSIHGLSAEAPVPVVKVKSIYRRAGMSGNVDKLLQNLGGVDSNLITSTLDMDTFPTKNRLMDDTGNQLARWDENDWNRPYTKEHWQAFEAGVTPDAIIISDYNKGSLDAYGIGRLRYYAECGTPLFIDSKRDPFIWMGVPATLFPNSPEYAAYAAHYDWMPSVVRKMGAEGMGYQQYGQTLWRQPALATQVRNVCGAGDAVIAAFTWAAVRGHTIGEALQIANAAAAQLVSQEFGDRHLRVPEVYNDREGKFRSEVGNIPGDDLLDSQRPDPRAGLSSANIQDRAVSNYITTIG